ncbi:DUF2690 domain-containing protein [Nonomuraea sp. NPDC050680]|uniref:DUF2690 domain-containing protein n=1 Tax=Nonomuraea sp. NPDC050680 TaxID=3154630 RepID=UPI0033C3AD07
MRLHWTPAILAGLALALLPWTGASAVTGPPDGHAAGGVCYGTACDGKDPADTGCTENSYTVRSGGVLVRAYAFGGYVELRYGPGQLVGGRRTCQVNWARFVKQGQGADYNVWVQRRPARAIAGSDKRLTQYSGGDEGTGVIYSDQVYAADVPAMACVERAPLGRTGPERAARTAADAPVCTIAI